MTEEQYGKIWKSMARAEGHMKRLPNPTTSNQHIGERQRDSLTRLLERRGPMRVGEINQYSHLSRQSISQHLAVMVSSGAVIAENADNPAFRTNRTYYLREQYERH